MGKRLLDCTASDVKAFTKEDWLYSIGANEGRTLACETIGTVLPLFGDVTNAEVAASLGADILLLNIFDVEPDHSGVAGCKTGRTGAGIKAPYRADDSYQPGAGRKWI